MNPTISVIIPVYNLEGVISRSLNSIVEQDYENLEIIIVNDASKDNTLSEAEEVLKKSNRKYKLITMEKNSGVSSARNRGIEASSGDFLMFFDGDDECDRNMVSSLYTSATQTESPSDITICGYRNLYFDTGIIKKVPVRNKKNLKNSSIQELVVDRILNKFEPSLSTLYTRELIMNKGIRYTDGCAAGEDGEFFMKALVRAESISYADNVSYIYIHRNSQVKETAWIKRYDDNARAIWRTYEYIAKYATEAKLRKINEYLLKPEACFRKLSSAAHYGNRENFEKVRKSIAAKELLSSIKVFFIKPEYFLKSLYFLFFPGMYYEHYRKRCTK